MIINLNLHVIEYELSPIRQGDGAALISIMADEETQRFLPQLCNLFDEINGFPILLHSFEQYQKDGTGFLLGIRRDYDLLGFIAIMDIPQCPSIFYAMHPKYRGKGIMKECVKEVLEYLSINKMCSYVQTYVSTENERSQNLLFKLGFERTEKSNEEDMVIYVKMM